jgi:hypothetical protein
MAARPPSTPGRYSPAVCTGARLVAIEGFPDPKHISSSFVELRMTPALAAAVTDKLWEMADLVAIVEASDKPAKRGSYKNK